MIELKPCPICGNDEIKICECIYNDKPIAYNVHCEVCNFTDRTYKMKIKALSHWNHLVEQCKDMNKEKKS